MSGVDQSWMERWYDTWRSALRLARKRGYVPVPKRQSAAALPRNLKRLREAKGWSVARLARESVVHGSTIMSIEVGDMAGSQQFHDPKLSTCLKLARVLGVGIEALVEERES